MGPRGHRKWVEMLKRRFDKVVWVGFLPQFHTVAISWSPMLPPAIGRYDYVEIHEWDTRSWVSFTKQVYKDLGRCSETA